jgi:hypothetical protein
MKTPTQTKPWEITEACTYDADRVLNGTYYVTLEHEALSAFLTVEAFCYTDKGVRDIEGINLRDVKPAAYEAELTAWVKSNEAAVLDRLETVKVCW